MAQTTHPSWMTKVRGWMMTTMQKKEAEAEQKAAKEKNIKEYIKRLETRNRALEEDQIRTRDEVARRQRHEQHFTYDLTWEQVAQQQGGYVQQQQQQQAQQQARQMQQQMYYIPAGINFADDTMYTDFWGPLQAPSKPAPNKRVIANPCKEPL